MEEDAAQDHWQCSAVMSWPQLPDSGCLELEHGPASYRVLALLGTVLLPTNSAAVPS